MYLYLFILWCTSSTRFFLISSPWTCLTDTVILNVFPTFHGGGLMNVNFLYFPVKSLKYFWVQSFQTWKLTNTLDKTCLWSLSSYIFMVRRTAGDVLFLSLAFWAAIFKSECINPLHHQWRKVTEFITNNYLALWKKNVNWCIHTYPDIMWRLCIKCIKVITG